MLSQQLSHPSQNQQFAKVNSVIQPENKDLKYQKRLDELTQMVSSNQNPNNYQLLKAVIEKPPYQSKSEELKQKYAFLFQQVLGKIQLEKYEELIKFLKDDDLVNLFEYMNKSFEMVSRGIKCLIHTFNLFQLHQVLVKIHGNSVILKAISKKQTLVQFYDNNFKELYQ